MTAVPHAMVSRRLLLGGAAAALTIGPRALMSAARAQAPSARMPLIFPRTAWGAELPPTGPLEVEVPGDVRFLLVHHTADRNTYGEDDVADMLRSIFRLHTAPEKGWPDVAYNFLIDRYGRIWEGRQGSIEQPVKGSATGGSQGFAMLASYIGNMDTEPPTPQAEQAYTDLLAWLAGTYGINPAGQVTFTSRGSNRHPAGTPVTTPTITGHNQMSQTVCPGRFGDEMIVRLRTSVPAAMTAVAADSVPASAPSESSAGQPAPSATRPSATPPASTAPTPDPAAASAPPAAPARAIPGAGEVGTTEAGRAPLIGIATGLLAVVGGVAAATVRGRGAVEAPWTSD